MKSLRRAAAAWFAAACVADNALLSGHYRRNMGRHDVRHAGPAATCRFRDDA